MSQRDNAACLESLQLFLDQAMIPMALEGLQSMYKQGEEIRLAQSAENLTSSAIMLQLLDEVRTWTQVLLDEEVRRIEARIPYLQKLLTALFVMKVKVLSCINMRKETADFPLTIPSNHTFVHNMYIHAARALMDNSDIIDDMRLSSMRGLLSDALRRAEFDCLRWDELLTWGLDGVDPSDALRDIMNADPAKDDEGGAETSPDPPPPEQEEDDDDLKHLANDEKAEDEDDAEASSGGDPFAEEETRRVSDDADASGQPGEPAEAAEEPAPADPAPDAGAPTPAPDKGFW